MRKCRHAALPRARTAQYYKRRAGDLELEREAGLGGGSLLEAGLGGVIEAVVAQAAGGRRSTVNGHIRSGWCGRDGRRDRVRAGVSRCCADVARDVAR